ncbi:MAG: HAD family hydrolase [Rhodospirillales bacterium]|nr:MAG: HAD family hydrolase [Rhodospirillales bacterium]
MPVPGDVPPETRGAVFFDRDGVLNEDHGYVHRIEDLRWIPGAREAVRTVNLSGRFVFVVTNQAGIAKGLYDEAAVHAFHAEMQHQLLAIGARVDAFVHCPHHPQGLIDPYIRACSCRKPEPGMILGLLQSWPVLPAASVLIGDRDSDIAAARAAGIAARLYRGGDLRDYVHPPA